MKLRSLATVLVAVVPGLTFACGDDTNGHTAPGGGSGADATVGGDDGNVGASAGSANAGSVDSGGKNSADAGAAGMPALPNEAGENQGGSASQGGNGASLGGNGDGIAGEMQAPGGAGAAGDTGVPTDPCDVTQAPSIEQSGDASHLLLRGMVVTPDQAFAGEVLVTDDLISCVAASCSGSPGAAGATVVETHGIIFPGLIDTHNHVLFDAFDETDWSPIKAYDNHNQWTNEAKYSAMVDAKQYLNGESASPVDYNCELEKYGELKGLIAGTTSIVGAATPANKACYGSLSRSIGQSSNGLGSDKVQVATLFPATAAADGVCNNFANGKTDAYLIHVAEGVGGTIKSEFAKLGTVTGVDNCLYSPKTTIVHGTDLGAAEFDIMAAQQMSLVWSPKSEIFLYGAGTDPSKTTNVELALSKGINVALGPNWSMGGSQNLLDELRFAQQIATQTWTSAPSAKTLVQMATTNAARALGLQGVLGSIEIGKKADLMVISGNSCAPYDSLLAATPAEVELVLVGGKALYGHPKLKSLGAPTPGCDTFDACGSSKFLCVATSSNTALDKLGQKLAEIQTTLSDAFVAYDALNLTAWKFAPITPLLRCQ